MYSQELEVLDCRAKPLHATQQDNRVALAVLSKNCTHAGEESASESLGV